MGFFDKDNKKPISPIEFVGDKYRESPISFMDKDINNTNSFAILKTTEGGRYMRGNLLYYSLNGVEVYTEANNIIFVDTTNNVLFIRDYEKTINGIAPVDPEERQYIILYVELFSEDEDSTLPLLYDSVQGRSSAYEVIKYKIETIDIDKSLVLVDNVPLKDALSVREFIKYLQNADIVDKYEIDVDSYFGSEYI